MDFKEKAENFIAVSVILRQGFIRLHSAKRNMRHFHGSVVPLFTTTGTNQERRTELFILNCCFQGDRENRKNICGQAIVFATGCCPRLLKRLLSQRRRFVSPVRNCFLRLEMLHASFVSKVNNLGAWRTLSPDFAFHTILGFSHGLFPVPEAAGILTGLILPSPGHCWNFKVLITLL